MGARSGRSIKKSRERRVARTYRLSLSKIEAARRELGCATATEAIEQALDLVVFRRELIQGTEAMFGITIVSPDDENDTGA